MQFEKPVLMPQPLPQGKTGIVMDRIETAAGTSSVAFDCDAEAVQVALYVGSISGDLDVTVRTVIGDDDTKTFTAETFPTVSAPTSQLVIQKAATIMSRVVIDATWTDAVDFEIRVRGISAAESGVRILGAQEASASSIDIGTTPTVIIPAGLSDRSGLIIKNNNTASGILYIGFTAGQATSTDGYPLRPLEPLGIDVDAGVTIYGAADAGTIDVRILEAGG